MTLDRRSLLMSLPLTAIGLCPVRATPFTPDLNAMTYSWASFADHAAAFRIRAMKRGLTAIFVPGPIDLTIAAPASEAEVLAVEAEIGRPLPSSLRDFFRDFSSHFTVSWVMPGPNWIDAEGHVHTGISLSPPTLEMSNGRGELEIGGGQIEISLADIAPLWRGHQAALRRFEVKAQQGSDAHEKAFYDLRKEFYSRAFPFSTGEEGDVVGVDMTDAQQRVLLLSGEAADEPGFFLGQNMREHLNQQVQLGFVGFVLSSLLLFKNDVVGAATVKSSLLPFEAAAGQSGLVLPVAVVVDADGANGRIWREWLGP